jgi:sortase (surface protein transpeptidase)
LEAEKKAVLIECEKARKKEEEVAVAQKNRDYLNKSRAAQAEADKKADALNKNQNNINQKADAKTNDVQQIVYTVNIPSFSKSINVNNQNDVSQLTSLIQNLIDAKLSSGM